MRYGVLADVHGNLHALQAALRVLRREAVDAFICAGDLVGYGPYPNECVEAIAGLDAICVAGNHDLIALDLLSDERCGPLARESLSWTRSVLSPSARRYLSGLPPLAETGDGIVVAHGTLYDPEEYTRGPDQARVQLERLALDRPAARILVLGHTHRAFAYPLERGELTLSSGSLSLAGAERCLINPGSVGQSRERLARARFLVLDLDRDRGVFHAIRYDTRSCRRALREHGLAPNSCHPVPPPLVRARRRFRRLRGKAV